MEGKRRHRGEAVILTTLSANGFPHHSFLSEDEWYRHDEASVSLAIIASSRTASNLAERRTATLLFLSPSEVRTAFLRMRGRSASMAADPTRRRFLLAVKAEVVATTAPGEIARLERQLSYVRWQDLEERRRRRRVTEELGR